MWTFYLYSTQLPYHPEETAVEKHPSWSSTPFRAYLV